MDLLHIRALARLNNNNEHKKEIIAKIGDLQNKIEMFHKQYKKAKEKRINRNIINDYYKELDTCKNELDKLNDIPLLSLKDISDDDIVEDDWNKLLCDYDFVFNNLKQPYKSLFSNIKHLRTNKFYVLIEKLIEDDRKMHNFYNTKHETVHYYFSSISESDFYLV